MAPAPARREEPVLCPRTGKRSYKTQIAAAVDIARFRGRPGRQPIRSYQCDHCYGFHITATPRPWG